MRTLLVFPPQAHFTQPYLALPSLTAWLRAHGFEDTSQWDVNLESLEYFLTRERLARSREVVERRLAGIESDRALPLAEMDRFRTLAEAALAGDAVVEGIEEAKAVLRDPVRFYDYDAYVWAVKTLDRAFKLFSAEWYPTALTPNSFSMRFSIEREADVLEAIGSEEENPYLEFYRARVLPRILKERPDLLGISITYGTMIVPALTLARLVRQALPDCHITVGGGLLAYAGEKMARSGRVFDVIDSIVLLEGEGPLLALARAVEEGRPPDDVPNLIHRRGGRVVRNDPAPPLDIDTLPTPDFDGLPLDRYFSPHVALPLAITRGCYYEKCVFCTLYKVIGPGYRQRALPLILDDIEKVTERYGSKYVYFVVEDMPPVLLRKLPDALLERGLDIRWWTDARLESGLYTPELCRKLHRAGCRRIAFGFESASQRVLDLMEKGTAIDEAEEIVRNVAEAGIAVVLYTMIGFPTETEEEARRTLAWIRAHRPHIQEVSLRIFYLDHLSTVFREPERFGVTRIHEDPSKDYQVYYDHECSSGIDRRRARELFFEFMETVRREFPLFQGDNLWFFELKSHHFLWLCHFERLDVFAGRARARVGEDPPEPLAAARPRLADGVSLRRLSHDLEQATRTLLEAEDRTLRPRYQSGSFRAEMIEQLGDRMPPLPPRPTFFAYRARSGDFVRLGDDAARILSRFDGRRTVGEVLEELPGSWRAAVERFVRDQYRRGLLTDAAKDRRFERRAASGAESEVAT